MITILLTHTILIFTILVLIIMVLVMDITIQVTEIIITTITKIIIMLDQIQVIEVIRIIQEELGRLLICRVQVLELLNLKTPLLHQGVIIIPINGTMVEIVIGGEAALQAAVLQVLRREVVDLQNQVVIVIEAHLAAVEAAEDVNSSFLFIC
jgi:hypothetical protein